MNTEQKEDIMVRMDRIESMMKDLKFQVGAVQLVVTMAVSIFLYWAIRL